MSRDISQRSALEQGVEVVTPGRTQGDTHEGVARAEVVPNAGTGPAGARPYISAARYAALLGCSRDVVIEDVKRGMAGELATITGGWAGDWIVVEGWETADERLDLHRKRLGLSPATSANEGLTNGGFQK